MRLVLLMPYLVSRFTDRRDGTIGDGTKWKIDSKVMIKTLMEMERNEMINEHTPSISCSAVQLDKHIFSDSLVLRCRSSMCECVCARM